MINFKPYQRISPQFVIFLYSSVLIFSAIYYALGVLIFNSTLTFRDYLIFTSILGMVVVGGYQLFFWTQHHSTRFKTRQFNIALDDKIPYIPSFIWIYSLIYYIMLGLIVSTLKSLEQGMNYIFGGLVLLTLQCLIFYFFPSTVPSSWRKYKVKSKSTQFLNFIQKLDVGRNCMPSMHMSIAMYVSLILFPILSYYSFIFVGLIAISTLFVKQHQILDLAPGVILGWAVYVIIL